MKNLIIINLPVKLCPDKIRKLSAEKILQIAENHHFHNRSVCKRYCQNKNLLAIHMNLEGECTNQFLEQIKEPGTDISLSLSVNEQGSADERTILFSDSYINFTGKEDVNLINDINAFLKNDDPVLSSVTGSILDIIIRPVKDENESVKKLSPQENKVMKLLAEGLTINKISEHFNLSYHTVKNHTHNIYRKLDVRNRVDAVKKYCLVGILLILNLSFSPDSLALLDYNLFITC